MLLVHKQLLGQGITCARCCSPIRHFTKIRNDSSQSIISPSFSVACSYVRIVVRRWNPRIVHFGHYNFDSIAKLRQTFLVSHRQSLFYLCHVTCDFQLFNFCNIHSKMGTAVAQWVRCCATNGKVAGSIPAGVSGFPIYIKFFRSHYGPGVDSASNRNEYQEYFLGVKAAGA